MTVTPLSTQYFTTPAILHLSILPTEKCNFHCLYCNQSFLAGAMRPETVEGIKQLLLNRKQDLKRLIVSWFGGEPLLGYSTIIEIMEFISAKIRANDGPSLKSGMTTNGYLLTPERLRMLAALGVQEFPDSSKWYRRSARRSLRAAVRYVHFRHHRKSLEILDLRGLPASEAVQASTNTHSSSSRT